MRFEDLLATPTYVAPDGKQTTKEPRATQVIKDTGEHVVQTGLIDGSISATDEYLEAAGFDPKAFMLKPGTGIRKSKWQALRRESEDTVIQDMQSVRLEVVERRAPVDMDELIAAVERQEPPAPQWRSASDLDYVFVVAWGDEQAGKLESDASDWIPRFKSCIAQAVQQYKRSGMSTVHLAALGDAVEGFVSQGGRNAWRTTLTITEQMRLMRRLYLWVLDQFVDAGAGRITFVTVASNHGQAMRQPVTTRDDDDFGIEILVALNEAIAMNPERYGHVQIVVPGKDEGNVTIPLAGLVVAHSHGHKFYKANNGRQSVFNWWRGHRFSGMPEGQATLLLTGHGHHMEMAEESGSTWIMVPATEAESVWWKSQTGQTGDPGMVTFTIEGERIGNINRLRSIKSTTQNEKESPNDQ